MADPEFGNVDPKDISEADKLRMAVGEKGELPGLSPTERSDMEIELEAFERGLTPQDVLAERLRQALQGDRDD